MYEEQENFEKLLNINQIILDIFIFIISLFLFKNNKNISCITIILIFVSYIFQIIGCNLMCYIDNIKKRFIGALFCKVGFYINFFYYFTTIITLVEYLEK